MKTNLMFIVGAILIVGAAFLFSHTNLNVSLPTLPSLPGIFSVERNVSVEISLPQRPVMQYYVYGANVTIYPSEDYEIDVGNIINVETPITFVGFRGRITFNDTLNLLGRFSSIEGSGFAVNGGTVKGIYNLTFEKVIVEGLEATMPFNNTRGLLKTDDVILDMDDKYVVLKSFSGQMEVTNVTSISGKCSKIIIRRQNEIVIS